MLMDDIDRKILKLLQENASTQIVFSTHVGPRGVDVDEV